MTNEQKEEIREELKKEVPKWFSVNETSQTRLAGGIVDFEVKFTKGGLETIIIPEMAEFFISKLDSLLTSQRESLENKYKEALIWCSGSEDFQLEGKAREGWEKICFPLITQCK